MTERDARAASRRFEFAMGESRRDTDLALNGVFEMGMGLYPVGELRRDLNRDPLVQDSILKDRGEILAYVIFNDLTTEIEIWKPGDWNRRCLMVTPYYGLCLVR